MNKVDDFSPLTTRVERTVLKNGIRIVTERMPYMRSASIGVWVKTGSGQETQENNGIAHFVEHMLFKGSKKRSAKEIAASLESLGGLVNGSTGKEICIYNAHVLDENMDIAIDVLADLVQYPKFELKDVEHEKQVILSEIVHSKEDPQELAFDYFFQNAFPGHPLGFFILGNEDNVKRFSRDDLCEFHQHHYTPDRFVCAAAGNVNHDEFVRLVEQHFTQHIPSHELLNPPLRPPQPENTLQLPQLHQAHICFGYKIFGQRDKRRTVLALLDVLLGGGMSSRLFQNIREKYGFAYNVFSFADTMEETGVFGAYMACHPFKVNKSLELLENEFDALRNGSIEDAELSDAKSQVKGNLILGLESSSRRMRKIGESETYGRPHKTIQEIVDKVEQIRIDDLLNLANDLFTDDNKSITVITL